MPMVPGPRPHPGATQASGMTCAAKPWAGCRSVGRSPGHRAIVILAAQARRPLARSQRVRGGREAGEQREGRQDRGRPPQTRHPHLNDQQDGGPAETSGEQLSFVSLPLPHQDDCWAECQPVMVPPSLPVSQAHWLPTMLGARREKKRRVAPEIVAFIVSLAHFRMALPIARVPFPGLSSSPALPWDDRVGRPRGQ